MAFWLRLWLRFPCWSEGISWLAEFLWYVAQALPGLEATAVYHLTREGITAFAPAIVKKLVNGKPGSARIFPGYVFVELESADESGVVNRTRGIHKLLPIHANAPLPLPTCFVDDLRARMAGGAFDEDSQDALVRKFVPEQIVTWGGPLAGACPKNGGKFLRYHKGAGVVLGYLLGREIEMPIPLHQIAVAGVFSHIAA